MNKLSIIIPVFNEVSTIEEVIKQLSILKLKKVTKEIIVIDDGSFDGTAKILKKIKDKYKLKLLTQANLGKGSAVRNGLKLTTGNIIIIQDADLEYKISEYAELLEPILENRTKFVIGSRHLQTGGWKTREFLDSKFYAKTLNFGGVMYGKIVNLLFHVNLTDPGSMYKVFRKECLKDINLKSKHFDIDWELVAKMIKKGYIPLEISISYKSRSPKEGKKIKFLRDGYLILFAIFKYRFLINKK